MWQMLIRGVIAGVTVVAVAVVSRQFPRLGALLLTLPLVSILAFITAWQSGADLPGISRLARETLILVPLGLPFFAPLAFAGRMNLSFWPALAVGIVLASATIGTWFWIGPKTL